MHADAPKLCQNDAPQVDRLCIVGRHAGQENHDICGEYLLAGFHHGRAYFQKCHSTTVIRWWPSARRWLVDRHGVRDSGAVVAFADAAGSAIEHPGDPELIWQVWDAAAQKHVSDSNLLALDVPPALTVMGRQPGRENDTVNGEYDLVSAHHGRPVYAQRDGALVIRYNPSVCQWLIAPKDEASNRCCAFAPADTSKHPANVLLQWQFWESSVQQFAYDAYVRALDAPSVVHVVQSAVSAQPLYGTYRLIGACEGRPVYHLPGSQNIIRYAGKHNRWLVSCGGAAKPGIVSRLCEWIISGDASLADEQCSAFADACGAPHPGHASLIWHVWDATRGRHTPDHSLCCTDAPLVIAVTGRATSRDNSDICGMFMLVGAHLGRPYWQQRPGSRLTLRVAPEQRRWIIERDGPRTDSICTAFAEDACLSEYPAPSLRWHVYEAARGCHLLDPEVSVTRPSGPPQEVKGRCSKADVAVRKRKAIALDNDESSMTSRLCRRRRNWGNVFGA